MPPFFIVKTKATRNIQ